MMADNFLSNDHVLAQDLNQPTAYPENLPLEEVEKRSILEALAACGGNKSEAARRLGITRKTLRKKLEKYESA
jgi:DNA-binding NtrC family response regulator